MIGHRWQSGEDVAQIRERVFPEALAGDDDGVDDRGALAGVGVVNEQLVLTHLRASKIDPPAWGSAGLELPSIGVIRGRQL